MSDFIGPLPSFFLALAALFLAARSWSVARRAPAAAPSPHDEEHGRSLAPHQDPLDDEPAAMIQNVLDLRDMTVGDVMVPRTQVRVFELGTALRDVIHTVREDGHSRYPVFQGSPDQIVGLLYVKDLFALLDKDLDTTKLNTITRKPALFVVEAQSALSVLKEMRQKRQHLAVVTDAFGGTAGIVTLEDILEQIVGDIRDEYDTEAERVVETCADGTLVIDASTELESLRDTLGEVTAEEDEVHSLGGLVASRLGRIPQAGDVLIVGQAEVTVVLADATHALKLSLRHVDARADTPGTKTPTTLRPPTED